MFWREVSSSRSYSFLRGGVVFTVLLLAFSLSLMAIPTCKAAVITTYVEDQYVSPIPGFVGHNMSFYADIGPDPGPRAPVEFHIIKPDGGPIYLLTTCDPSGLANSTYKPDMVGTYNFTVFYAGAFYGDDFYMACWGTWISFDVQNGPPTGSIVINGGDAFTSSTSVTLSLTYTAYGATVSQVRYSNDGIWDTEPWETPAASKAWTLTPGDGAKVVYYQVKDSNGDLSSTYSDSIVLDTTPPTGTIVINGGAAYTTSRTVTLTLSASDATSSVYQMHFSENMGAWGSWVAYATTYTYNLIIAGDGNKDVDVQFMDSAGNTSPEWSIYDTIVLDTTPPTGSIVINDDELYTASRTVELSLSASDATTAVTQMRFSEGYPDSNSWGPWIAYSTTYSYTMTEADDGTKAIDVQFMDSAGNTSPEWSIYDTIVLDTTPPTGSIVINDGASTTTSVSVTLSLTYGDATSGVSQVRYSNDGIWDTEPWETPAATKAWTLTSGDGLKTVWYQVMDNAGLVSTAYSDDITLKTTSPTNCYLVVRGSNNGIYYQTYNVTSASWNGWNSLPGSTGDPPTATAINNELHIVVRGSNSGQIWHSYINVATNAFSGWELLSGSTPSPPTLTGNGTHLCLVVRGSNNQIYYRFYTLATRTWTDWTAVPNGLTTDTPAATLTGSSLQVVVKGSNSEQIWYGAVSLPSGSFSGWSLLSGTTPSTPTLCNNGTSLCLIVRGSNSQIYYRWYNLATQTWGGWSNLPAGTTPDTPAATITGDKLQIVVRGSNSDQLWYGKLQLSTSTWSGWTMLDGSTPSKPVLTS
jgi:hypothetical protein